MTLQSSGPIIPPPVGTKIAPPSRVTLITEPGTTQTFTAMHTVDAKTALTKGLADYLRTVVIDAEGGRQLRFVNVFETWAEPDQKVQFPSAAVLVPSEGMYEAKSFTPVINPKCRVPLPDGRYLVSATDLVLDMEFEVWANDPKERAQFMFALESMLNPVTYMYGFVLELPFYFNERAVYEMKGMQYLDDDADAIKRYRRGRFRVTGQVPVVQLVKIPDAKPRVDVVAVGVDVVVTTSS